MEPMDTKPSTHYHPLPVTLFNGVARGLNAIGLAKIDLSEASLLAAARRQTGLVRFGDESFLPALRMLLTSLWEESRLNPFGRAGARARIIRCLKNRLWANACFEAHPEILQRKIAAPIIIVGPGRSGTTRMQRMLAADPRLQHLKAWEGFNPAPRPGQPDMGKAARREEVKKFLDQGQRLNPGAATAHPMDVDWAEEEILLLHHSFSALWSLCFRGHYDWFLGDDRTPAYRYMADLMKLLSWSRGDAEDKRWVMKTPQYMLDLDVLMKIFPDAKVVFMHRDPLKTVASTMSLMWHFVVQNIDRPCRELVRDTWLDVCEEMARRSMRARETIPPEQQLDIYYEDVNRDWRAATGRIYDFIGIDFTPQAEQAIAAWLSESESENRHGGHRYSYEEFGASAKETDARMMFYRERYAVPYEGK
jgi:hypothetical protein